VVVVGLNSGLQAVVTVKQLRHDDLRLGVVVTIVPLLSPCCSASYVLRYNNTAVLAGALSGSRSANPAFGERARQGGERRSDRALRDHVCAWRTCVLTLLGPLIVALV
jgi:putative transport protein